ncbi:MAG: hypothetical protein FWD94_06035 [Treponema sp.]|nr:hypothetical protein [Treponema sp.]
MDSIFEKQEYDPWIGEGEDVTEITVYVGKWKVELTGFRDADDGEPVKIAYGEKEIDVRGEEGEIHTITLFPVLEGKGTFKWAVEFPEDSVEYGKMDFVSLTDPAGFTPLTVYLDGFVDENDPEKDPSTVEKVDEIELPAGNYRVTFTFQKNGELYTGLKQKYIRSEVLHIYNGIVTEHSLTVTEKDFPVSLLEIILSSWDKDGWNLQGGGIRGVHFKLLNSHGVTDELLQAKGLSGINGWFDKLEFAPDHEISDETGLAKLVDAALVGIGTRTADLGGTASYYRRNVIAEIAGMPKNGNTPTFSWSPSSSELDVTVGGYKIAHDFGRTVYDYQVIFRLADGEVIATGGPFTAYAFDDRDDGKINLNAAGFERTYSILSRWNLKSDLTGASFNAGAQFKASDYSNGNDYVNLYAEWDEAQVTGVAVTGDKIHTVRRDADLNLNDITVKVTAHAGSTPITVDQSVQWTIVPNGNDKVHNDTRISSDGKLLISADEPLSTFRLRVASALSPAGPYDFVTINIPATPRKIIISTDFAPGVDPVVVRGQSLRLTGTVEGLGTAQQLEALKIEWAIEPYPGKHVATTVSTAGVLSASGVEPFGRDSLTVNATVMDGTREVKAAIEVGITGEMVQGRWKSIKVGIDHTVAITWQGELFTWGWGTHGQLGHGTRILSAQNQNERPAQFDELVPTQVIVEINGTEVRDGWVLASGGWAHTVALREDGTIWGSGRIFSGTYGNTNQTGVDFNKPTASTQANTQENIYFEQIGIDRDWNFIVASHSSVYAIKKDGKLYAWGRNGSGVLGVGDAAFKYIPTPVLGPPEEGTTTAGPARTDWAYIAAAGDHVLATTRSGQLFGWGSNNSNRLGNPTSGSGGFGSTNFPRTVGNPDWRWKAVAAGNGWSIGIVSRDGPETDYAPETAVAGGLYTWGSNGDNKLGTGSNNTKDVVASPRRIISSHKFESIGLANTTHGVAIDTGGGLWSWGNNLYGQLGTENAFGSNRSTPMRITQGVPLDATLPVDISDRRWTTSITGGSFSFAINSLGELWAWGHNQYGMLGTGDKDNRHTPQQIPNPSSDPEPARRR